MSLSDPGVGGNGALTFSVVTNGAPVPRPTGGNASGKKWRECDTIKFVELYEKAECLWNFRHAGYKHRNGRDRAIQSIIEEMNLPDFGVNELKNKIKNIRSTYQQEVNKIRRSRQGLGAGGDIMEEYKTNLAWFPIADRFLGSVINSTKNLLPKAEEDDPSCFHSSQSALYNLVETEMNGELEQEMEEKFTPFTISIDNIKEEIVDNNDYIINPSVTINPTVTLLQPKKRKSSHHPPLYDNFEHNNRPLEDLKPYHQINDTAKDEWYHFGNNIACQLRNLPLESALVCQQKIVDILTQERIDHIQRSRIEDTNVAYNE